LRAFCLEEKETANLRLKELLLSLEIRNRLKDWLQQLSLENLPVSTVRQLRRTTGEVVRTYIRERGEPLLKDFGSSVDWDNVAVLIVNRLQSSTAVTGSLGLVSEELASILERYLEDDLEKIVKQIIPILAIDQVIINRINETPAAELETAVQAIVRSELQAIVNLGGVLGLIIGGLQTGFFLVSRGF
jgi:uncharacterized membrane protein YheB (UPF0754 family)